MEGDDLDIFQGTLLVFAPRDWEKPCKTSVRIGSTRLGCVPSVSWIQVKNSAIILICLIGNVIRECKCSPNMPCSFLLIVAYYCVTYNNYLYVYFFVFQSHNSFILYKTSGMGGYIIIRHLHMEHVLESITYICN